MDLRKLKKLIDLVEESGISELELTEGEEKVRISRALMHSAPQVAHYMAAPQPAVQAQAAPVTAEPDAAPAEYKDMWLNHPWSALSIDHPRQMQAHL